MTGFGHTYFDLVLRVRLALVAGSLALVALIQWQFPGYPSRFLFWLVAGVLCLALLKTPLQKNLGTQNLLRLYLSFDLLIVTLAIFDSGGVYGGLAALYALVPLVALLLLGRIDAIRLALAGGVLFLIQVGLDLAGVSALSSPPPLVVTILGQSAVIVIFFALTFVYAVANLSVTQQLSKDKNTAEAERALAERARQQWVLINTVALRVQESTSPQEAYRTVGQELERGGLHCAFWEWAHPGESMRATFVSIPVDALARALTLLRIDIESFRLHLKDNADLRAAVTERVPVFVPNPVLTAGAILPAIPPTLLPELLKQIEMCALVFAPMLFGNSVNGILMVYGKQLDQSDVALFAALAHQVGSALEKARLLSEQRKRATQLEIVSELSTRVNVTIPDARILQQVVDQVRQTFGYSAVSILEINLRSTALNVLVTANNLPGVSNLYTQDIQRGIIGMVARTGEMYLTGDARHDAHYMSAADTVDAIRSELTIPLKQGQDTFAVWDVQSTQLDAFDAGDVRALSLLAEQIGAALVKSKALAAEQKRAAHLAWVNDVAAHTTTFTDPDAIIKALIELIQARFGYHHVSFSRFDTGLQEMELQFVAGNNASLYRIGKRWSATHGLIGLAARTRQTIFSADVTNDTRYMFDQDAAAGANSELCVPILSGEQLYGVLDVESVKRDAFDGHDIGAMEALAGQIAVALEKAHSLQIERRRAAQLALVNRIASRTARLVPTEQLLKDAVEMTKTQFGYFNVAIFLRERGSNALHLAANSGELDPIAASATIIDQRGIIAFVSSNGLTYVCTDARTDPHYYSPFPPPAQDPVISEIAIPLRRGASVIGVLDIQTERLNAFSPEDITALEVLADQLATAIENARLFESEARRAAQLDAVRLLGLKLTAERDLDMLLHFTIMSAMDLVHADGATLDLLDEARKELVVYLSQNLSQNYVGYRLEMGRGLAGRVAASGEALIIADYATWEGHAAEYANDTFAGMLAIPLKWQARILGVISLHRSRGRAAFTEQELSLADLFATHAAIALENARLFDALQARLHALQALTEISGTLLETTDPQGISEQAARAALRALESNIALLFLEQENRQLALSGSAGANAAQFKMTPRLKTMVEKTFETRDAAHWNGNGSGTGGADSSAEESAQPGIVVPMQVGERAVGVIAVIGKGGGQPFDATDTQTLALLANQTASALERAKYLAQEQRRAYELSALYEMYRATSSTMEPHQVIQRLLEQLVRALGVTSAFYVQIDFSQHALQQTHEYYSEYASALEQNQNEHVWQFESLPGLELLLGRSVQLWQRADPDLRPEMNVFMQEHAVETILRVPLIANEAVIGYISLWESRAPRAWHASETRFAQAMASQAATVLLNAQLYQTAERRSHELHALYEVGRMLNRSLDVHTVCETSVDSLCEVFGYPHVSIYFVQDGVLHLQAKRGYPDTRETLPLTQGAMGRAIITRETAYAPQVTKPSDSLAPVSEMQSEIAVPLIAGERVLGVLNVESVRAREKISRRANLTPNDAQILNAFANQVVVAIENARLFQETQHSLTQLRTLHDAGQALNSELDPNAVLVRVAQFFVDALHVDSCTVNEWNSDTNQVLVTADLDPDTRYQIPIGAIYDVNQYPVMTEIFHKATPVAFRIDQTGLAQDIADYMGRYSWQSVLIVPLIGKGHLIGCVELGDRKRVRTFTNPELRLAESLATQATIAIENARLFQETQHHLAEVRTMHAAGQVLNSDLEFNAVLERVAGQFVSALTVDSCTLTEWDPQHNELVLLVDYDDRVRAQEPAGRRFPVEDAFFQTVLEHRDTIMVQRGNPTNDVEQNRYLDLYEWQSVLLVPLVNKGQVIGIVELGDRQVKRIFTGNELRLALSLAAQAAIAIENARLYQTAQQRLTEMETMYRFARELGSVLDIQELGKRALEAARQLTDFDLGEVSLLRESDAALVPLVNIGNTFAGQADTIVPQGVGITGWVVEHGRSARVGDVTRDPRYLEYSPYIMSELCLPLRVGESTIGVLNLEAKAPNAFDAHVERLLTVFANQLAIAIENARLYEQTKRDADVKATLLRELSHRVKNNLAAITSLLYMALDEPQEMRNEILSETLGRVQSMSTAHALLARSPVARVDLLELGRQVLHDTTHNLAPPHANIQVLVSGDHVSIAARQTTTLALVLNELATNALRHGWDGVTTHPLNIRFWVSRNADRISFAVQDDGIGLRENFDLQSNAGLGLNLVHTLAEKDLHGSFALTRRGIWTSAEVQFRLEEEL